MYGGYKNFRNVTVERGTKKGWETLNYTIEIEFSHNYLYIYKWENAFSTRLTKDKTP